MTDNASALPPEAADSVPAWVEQLRKEGWFQGGDDRFKQLVSELLEEHHGLCGEIFSKLAALLNYVHLEFESLTKTPCALYEEVYENFLNRQVA